MNRYGMFGLTDAEVIHRVDISRDDAVAWLRTCAWERCSEGLRVQFEGEWFLVCREDLMRQVGTIRRYVTIHEAIEAVIYGVRIDRLHRHYVIVDCLTDG